MTEPKTKIVIPDEVKRTAEDLLDELEQIANDPEVLKHGEELEKQMARDAAKHAHDFIG